MAKEKPNIDDVKMMEYSNSLENLPNNRELKCYLTCIYTAFGVLQNGKFNPKVAKEKIGHFKPEEQLRFIKLITGCKPEIKGADVCDMVYQFHLCAKKNSPEDFMTFWSSDIKVEA